MSLWKLSLEKDMMANLSTGETNKIQTEVVLHLHYIPNDVVALESSVVHSWPDKINASLFAAYVIIPLYSSVTTDQVPSTAERKDEGVTKVKIPTFSP